MKLSKREMQAIQWMKEESGRTDLRNIHVDSWLRIRGCGKKMISKLIKEGMASKSKDAEIINFPDTTITLGELLNKV